MREQTRRPRVLFVYYTLSDQTRRVVDAMADALSASGCEVTRAALEFNDPKWGRFVTGNVPMPHPAVNIPRILLAQRMRKTGEIRIPAEALDGDYDLVVFGSPTWWLTTNMPIRSYLSSDAAKRILDGKPFAAASVSRRYWKGNIKDIRKLGVAAGGRWVDETHFTVAGGQVKSMLAWLAYMKHGGPRNRVLGLKMPPPNLKPGFEEQARHFVGGVADRVLDIRAAGVAR